MLLDATWGWLDADNLLDERIRMSSRCLLSRFCRKLLMKEWAAVFDCDMDSSKISSFSLTFENVRLSFRSTTWLSSQHEYFLRSPRPTRIGPDYTMIKIYFVKSSLFQSNKACFLVCTNWPFVVFSEMASWSSLTFLSLKTLRSLMRPPLSRCRGIWLDSESRIHKKSCSHKFPYYIVKWEREFDLADHSYWRVVCVGRNRMVWIDIFTHNWCAIKLSRRIYTLNMIRTSITLLHTTNIRWQNDINENGLNKDFYRYILHIFVYTTFKTRKRPG